MLEVKDRQQRILRYGLITFGCIVILLSWGIVFYQIEKTKQSLLNSLKREQGNLINVLAENLFQVLEQKHTIELVALKWFSDRQQKNLNDITSFLYGEQTFTRVVLYDRSGRLFYQSSPQILKQQHKEDIKQYIDKMASVSKPFLLIHDPDSSDIFWQIPLLFPLKDERGRVKGAMLIELDIGYFLNLLQNINIGKTGKISITNDQGQVLAIFESGGLATDNGLVNRAKTDFSHTPSGTMIRKYPGLGDYHLTYTKVKNYTFIISISQRLDEFFSDFNQHKKRLFWILSILTMFCFTGLFMLIKMINRKHEYLNALTASDRKNNELIKKLEKEYQISKKAASFDSLTGLYNRRLFISLTQKNLSSAKRNRRIYAVLFADLDRFKTINDTLGHRIGDLLLQNVSKRLVSCTRKSDIIARFGGDEFVVMLTDVAIEQNITRIVEKIITRLSEPYENLDGHEVISSPSIGISIYPRDGEDIETLLRNADAAMYKAKHSGRGRYSFFDTSLNTVSIQKFELEQSMPSALSKNQFILHYQPKISLEDYSVVGLEALIRWQPPNYPLIYPADFIDIAEETGLIVELGRRTLEHACRQLTRWHSEGLKLIPIAVNVSPLELKDQTYSEQFFKTLANNQISPEFIEVEITENAIIKDKQTVIDNLQALSNGGVKISLDDFGKGFSNFDHIRTLPISTLKIDRSFVQDIRNCFNDSPIVSSTIILAQKLNMTVVAEGVETHDQLVNLKVAGCDQVQGYYISRPVPEKEIREFIVSPTRSIST